MRAGAGGWRSDAWDHQTQPPERVSRIQWGPNLGVIMPECRKGDIMVREEWSYGVALIYAQRSCFEIAQAFGKAELEVTLVEKARWHFVM